MVMTMLNSSTRIIRPPKRSGFLKLLVLDLLRDRQMHGYELMKELEKIFEWHSINPGVLYRLMRNLRDKGLVEIVEERERGKKVYAITDDGIKYLEKRKEDLARVLNKIEKVKELMKIGGKDLIQVIALLVENMNDMSDSQKNAIKKEISEFVQRIWDILEDKVSKNE